MAEQSTPLPPRMQKIVEMFRQAEGRDKLELLLDYSASMPKVPKTFTGKRDDLEAVHECATPLFVYAERNEDGKMLYGFDVPEVSPTVRGFAAILGLGLKDATPEEVLRTPGDLFFRMGLHKVLTPQRLNGSAALLGHMKRLAVREMQPESVPNPPAPFPMVEGGGDLG
jgi:cysteine desulfuration protein SufE